MFRPKSYLGLPSPGIYDLLSPFPSAWSRGEVGSVLGSRGERQEDKVGSEGWTICVSGSINGSKSVHLKAKSLGHLKQMPDARGQPKLISGSQTMVCSVPPHSSPLSMVGHSGWQWGSVGHTLIRLCIRFLEICSNKVPQTEGATTEITVS